MIVLNDLSREFEQLDMTYKKFNIIKLQSSNNINRQDLIACHVSCLEFDII